MNYPGEILPNINYKLITCDLSEYFLLRIIPTDNLDEIYDEVTDLPKFEFICSPRENIIDFSTSLLGVYKPQHIFLFFTEQGHAKYMHYCAPNEKVDSPVYEVDFSTVSNRHYWCVQVKKIDKVQFTFTVGRDQSQVKFRCLVRHTPMRWNYWHFSLHWETEEGEIFTNKDAIPKKTAQKIGHSARILLSQELELNLPNHQILPKECFCS